MLTILFDGVAYGMLLFVLACGLSVTLGLMNFVNLAHGSFAMAGGYITLVLVNRAGVPFFAGLPIAFIVTALIGALFERTLYVHVYSKSHLDQVLFTIGLVFMSVAAVDYVMGSQQVFIEIPSVLQGRFEIFGIGVGRYRLLIIVVCGLLTVGLQLILSSTRFGSRLRASVDDARVARGLGINVNAVFTLTFAFGSGLAGLGGALGRRDSRARSDLSAQIHGLLSDRGDGRRHVEHHRSVRCLAADRDRRCGGQVLRPQIRGVRDLHHHDHRPVVASAGPVRPRERQVAPRAAMPSSVEDQVAHHLAARARWRPLEYVFWLAAVASVFLLPGRHLILTEIAWLALFALSLDLILGYAGIISLGHAAFFGLGSYAGALLAKYGIVTEPVLALLVSGLCAAVLGFGTSFLVLRGSDLTRLMVTLGVALIMREIANQIPQLTGGADGLQGVIVGPILGMFDFDIFGHVSYVYCLVVLFVLFVLARRIVYSPFGLSLRAIKGNSLRASSIGISVNARLVGVYTLAAFYAGVAGALLAQTTAFASLDVFSFERSADLLLVLIIGGTGYLYGGLIGAVIFKLMQDWIANLTPQYWQFWIGLVLVLIVLVGRDRFGSWTGGVRALAARMRRRFSGGVAPVPVPPGEGR